MALTKLTSNLIEGGTGTDWVTAIQTSNFTAEAGKGYFVNTTSAEITITLPAGVVGTEIVIQDYAGTFATNKVLLSANGSEKIQGNSTDDFRCVTNDATVTLIYQDATKGWTADNIQPDKIPLTVDYLVVAGGGSGGTAHTGGGGGGAGGFLTNFGGTALILAASTNYNVTVGAGGASVSPGNSNTDITGISGSNSSIQFPTVINAIGGGGGGAWSAGGQALNGGSGGGGEQVNAAKKGLGTSGQGNDGGYGGNSPQYGAGGGGGAGTVGSNGTTSVGGNGGSGLPNSITGSNTTYAGGGGGGTYNGGTPGSGGSGGGGNAGSFASNGSDGSANTGGGGGGNGGRQAGNNNLVSGAGGSGIVILRYPSDYTITVPGGLTATTATVSTDKVTTFTSGTGNIQFN